MFMYSSNPDHDSNIRTVFASTSCDVYAYPSIGGIVVGDFSPVEMVHLGLDRFEPANRSANADEEDLLALRMLQLGANWWPDLDFYAYHIEKMGCGTRYDFHFPPTIHVAYPSSGKGVWVSKFNTDRKNWNETARRKPYLPSKPDDWVGKISMVLTMDERCDVLKSFGAIFYESVEACDDLPKTLKEGIEKGKRYRDLMKKLEDPDYYSEWWDEFEPVEA